MRRSAVIPLLALAGTLSLVLYSCLTLISLLFEDASRDAIRREDLPEPPDEPSLFPPRPELIPRIIHQTWVNESIPERWQAAQKSCIALHPDFEYVLWTDAKSREFIVQKYPWFLATFDGYKHPIQRADSIRYFVLSHFGGIYIDMDLGSNRRLTELLSFPAWVRRTEPTGISNDLMGAVPQHPFFLRVIESLRGADQNWIFPYITIMATTGPLFLSVIWKKWINEHASVDQEHWPGRVRVLAADLAESNTPWSFFHSYGGSSWHAWDVRLLFWMAEHWMLLAAAGILTMGLLGVGVWCACKRIQESRVHAAMDCRRHSGGSPILRSLKSPFSPLWRRLSGAKAAVRVRPMGYELLEQQDVC